MRFRIRHLTLSLTIAIFAANAAMGEAPDWPNFRGPKSDGKSTETGLLKQWPEGGPKLLWKIEGLGSGFSTVSIVDGKMFTMGDLERDGETSQYVMAFDLDTQKRLWETRVGPPHNNGSRCTPTVDGELTYALGTESDLVCVKTETGEVVWKKNLAEDFGGFMMSIWKFSESPLIDGEKLICTPGGKDATVVALDKKTGDLIWKCAVPKIGDKDLKDGAAYSSPVISEACGVRQYVVMFGRGVVGIDAKTGKFLWGHDRMANKVANCTNPVCQGDYVFATSSYKTGSSLLKLSRKGYGIKAEEVYFLGPDEFENHHGGVILHDGYIYGGSGRNMGVPVCFEFLTGKIKWTADKPANGSAAIVYGDGHMIWRYDKGEVFLVEATPEEFRIKGKLEPVEGEGPAWAHPVIHDGKLYLRHKDILACYDISE